MKFNILNHIKQALIGFGALVLVGVVILCIFGLNLGAELNGYIEVKVDLGLYNIVEDEAVKEHTDKIIEVLEENEAHVLQTNIEGSGFESSLVVQVRKVDKSRLENINFADKLEKSVENYYKAFDNGELLVVESSVVEGIMTNVNGVKLAYSLLISVLVVMIYLIFRLKFLNTICVLATTFASFILFFTLITLTRVQINTNIFGVIALLVILSLVLSTFKLADMKNSRVENLRKEEVGTLKINTPITKLLAIVCLGMICLVIFGSILVRNFAICSILSLLSVWLCDNLVCMPMCYYLNNYTEEKVAPVKEEKEKLTEENTVVNQADEEKNA